MSRQIDKTGNESEQTTSCYPCVWPSWGWHVTNYQKNEVHKRIQFYSWVKPFKREVHRTNDQKIELTLIKGRHAHRVMFPILEGRQLHIHCGDIKWPFSKKQVSVTQISKAQIAEIEKIGIYSRKFSNLLMLKCPWNAFCSFANSCPRFPFLRKRNKWRGFLLLNGAAFLNFSI